MRDRVKPHVFKEDDYWVIEGGALYSRWTFTTWPAAVMAVPTFCDLFVRRTCVRDPRANVRGALKYLAQREARLGGHGV